MRMLFATKAGAIFTARLISGSKMTLESKLQAALPHLKKLAPPMSTGTHKGQSGRVAVLGGSPDYTGAPYFSAISALKVGADLSYVFTESGASPVIKGYSPELMVTPVYELDWKDIDDGSNGQTGAQRMADTVIGKLSTLHSLVIGPGLGRDEMVAKALHIIMQHVKQKKLPVVIDAAQDMSLVANNTLVTLTPNVIEFTRLWKAAGFNDNELYESSDDTTNTSNKKLAPTLEHVSKLATHMGHVTIVLKSEYDHISDGHSSKTCHILGGLKRCGGLGTMTAWSNMQQKIKHSDSKSDETTTSNVDKSSLSSSTAAAKDAEEHKQEQHDDTNNDSSQSQFIINDSSDHIWALWWSSAIVRLACRRAYNEKGRSMSAVDAIQYIGTVIEEMIPS
eukprot:15570-Heterococcus_DN1.PRE.1